MNIGWKALPCGIAAAVFSAGCSPNGDTPADGEVFVTVTLSRSGPPGPSLDHFPQPGIQVTVTDASGGTWSDETDDTGEATLVVPSPGEYDVDISTCPDPPHHATVARGATTNVQFDCLAP